MGWGESVSAGVGGRGWGFSGQKKPEPEGIVRYPKGIGVRGVNGRGGCVARLYLLKEPPYPPRGWSDVMFTRLSRAMDAGSLALRYVSLVRGVCFLREGSLIGSLLEFRTGRRRKGEASVNCEVDSLAFDISWGEVWIGEGAF